MTTTTLRANEETMNVLREMLERTTRGVAQTAKEIERQNAQLRTKGGSNHAQQLVRQTRIESQIQYLQEIHAYQERVLRTLHALLS